MEFKFEAVQEYEVEATIDESKWGKEKLEEFSKFFHDVTSPKEILNHVIHNVIMFGGNHFVEGVGYVTVNGYNHGKSIKHFNPEQDPYIDESITIQINDPFPDIQEVRKKNIGV